MTRTTSLFLLVSFVVAGSTAAAAPGPSAIAVDLSSTAGGPITYQGAGILYGFSADATQPPTNYSRSVKLQTYRGGGGHSAPGYEQDQGAGFDKVGSRMTLVHELPRYIVSFIATLHACMHGYDIHHTTTRS